MYNCMYNQNKKRKHSLYKKKISFKKTKNKRHLFISHHHRSSNRMMNFCFTFTIETIVCKVAPSGLLVNGQVLNKTKRNQNHHMMIAAIDRAFVRLLSLRNYHSHHCHITTIT